MDISISIMDDHPDQLSCEKATKYPGKNLKKKNCQESVKTESSSFKPKTNWNQELEEEAEYN